MRAMQESIVTRPRRRDDSESDDDRPGKSKIERAVIQYEKFRVRIIHDSDAVVYRAQQEMKDAQLMLQPERDLHVIDLRNQSLPREPSLMEIDLIAPPPLGYPRQDPPAPPPAVATCAAGRALRGAGYRNGRPSTRTRPQRGI